MRRPSPPPQIHRHRQGLGADVDRDHVGAQRTGDHHRGQSDAATAVNRHPVARGDAPPAPARPGTRSRSGTRGLRRSRSRRGSAERGEGQIRLAKPHPLREASPAVKTRLELPVADLLVARAAGHAPPAPRDEGHGDAVARAPAGHIAPPPPRPHPLSRARAHGGSTMSGSCPTQPCQSLRQIPLASTRQHHAIGRQLGIGERFDGDGTAVPAVYCSLHGATAGGCRPAEGPGRRGGSISGHFV